jgi:nucleotide-binding universal stress UspA family protein
MKLLICSDGSEPAERALRLGSVIAANCRAEVTLLGIIENPGKSQGILDSLSRGQALLTDKKVRAELVTKAGEPVQEIIKRTEAERYDLVVIGATRKEPRGRFWMSSKSYKIMKEIQPPVLSVMGKTSTLKRVLVCSGGKRYIDSAVRLTAEIAGCMEASIALLHVLPEPPALYAHLPRMEQTVQALLSSNSELGRNLRHEKETLEAARLRTEVRLRRGSVLEEILREMHEGHYDLVVTGSALSRTFRTYVLGDITREIVNRAPCAVLVVRASPEAGESHGLRSWWGRFAPAL